MSRFALAAALALSAFSASAATSDSVIQVVNGSSRVIQHITLSPAGQDGWAGDRLSNESNIRPGGSFGIRSQCGTFDVRVEDSKGNLCQVNKVELCGSWTVTEANLGNCQATKTGIQ